MWISFLYLISDGVLFISSAVNHHLNYCTQSSPQLRMFSVWLVYLSVCPQDYKKTPKTIEWIFTKRSGWMGHGPRKDLLKSGLDPDKGSHPGFIKLSLERVLWPFFCGHYHYFSVPVSMRVYIWNSPNKSPGLVNLNTVLLGLNKKVCSLRCYG